MIRYGNQDIIQAVNDAVLTIIKSVNLTQDSGIEQFKQSVAANTAAQQSVAVKANDLGPCKWLWATPNTYLFEPKLMSAGKGWWLQRFLVAFQLAGVIRKTADSQFSPIKERLAT